MRPKTPFVVLWLVIALLCALAQTKGEEKPAQPLQDFSKEAFVIERMSTRITEENDGTGTREVTAEVKTRADAGVKAFAVLNFTYTSANEVVEVDYVRVRKPDGTVVKTPDYNIQDMPADVTRTAPLYSDIHEKHVAVKGLGVGDVLEYLVRFRVVKPEVPGHFWEEYSFTKTSISKDERLELSVPREKYVKVVSPDFKPDVKEEGARRVYRWIHTNLQMKEKDPDEIPRRIPPNPDVQVTTFASWEDVGRWYGDLQKDPLIVTPAIQAKAAELTKGLTTDDEKTHAIYNFVSLKFHYIGLDFGIGRYQPHAADDVLDNGYGDCKDKHTLLASLLKAAGIEAWPALIHATRKIDPEVPSPAQFNHVITVVPRGDKFLWLDTTPEVAPYGLLLLTLRDKQALVVPVGKAPLLMTTPANSPFPQVQEFTTKGKLGSDGVFTGHIEQSYRGDVEVIPRAAFRTLSESQWKDGVQRFSYGMNFGGEVSNVKVSPPDDLDKPFQLSYDYVRKNYADWENRQIVAPLPPMGLELVKNAPEKKPSEPFLLGALQKATFHSSVELPAGYLALAPTKCHLVESFAEHTGDTQIKGNLMTTTRELVVKKNEVALSDWSQYSKFGHALADDEFTFIRLNVSGVVANTPEEQEEELRESLKTNPRNLSAAAALGNLMMRSSRYPEAIEVLETAVKAMPDGAGLEYELGQAYLKKGDRDRAFAHMRSAIEKKDDDALILNNVAYALAENKTDLALAREYAEKALDELDDEAQDSESSSSQEAGLNLTYEYGLVWDALGWVYFQQGDAMRAESLIRAAWLLGEESIVGEHLGEVYEKRGKNEQAARAYEYALAVLGPAWGSSPNAAERDNQHQSDEISARFEKLTGKKPELRTTHRLPNGEWTKTPAEKLLHTREVKVANEGKLAGSAIFIAELKPGKVDYVDYKSGDDALKPLQAKLAASRYPVEFPTDSEAILVVRLAVSCKPADPCTAMLVIPIPEQQ